MVLLAILAALFVALDPPVSGQQPLGEEIDEARAHVEAASAEEAQLLADYEAVSARLADLDEQANALDASIAVAEAETAAAQAKLDAVAAEVAAARQRLAEITAELDAARVRFRVEAVEAYVRGGDPMYVAGAVFNQDDLDQAQITRSYANVVLVDHQAAIDRMRALEEDAELATRRLEEAKVAATVARDELAAHEAQLDADRAALEAVHDQTAVQAARQRDLVAQAQAKRAAFEQQLAELEAESARIQEELRRLAEEQARRRAASGDEANDDDGASDGDGVAGSGQLAWPLDPPISITSGFGYRTHPIYGTRRFHAGLDMDGDSGDPIYAAASGVVVRAEWCGGYGNCVVVDHGGGMATLYAHMSSHGTGRGAEVGRGERIGSVGSTGASTGPHLHFEVRINGSPVNPRPYLP